MELHQTYHLKRILRNTFFFKSKLVMKQLIALVLFLQIVGFSQKESKQSAPIEKITVFKEGAQIEHKKSIQLNPGKQVLVFEKLTDFVDPNSIQQLNGPLTNKTWTVYTEERVRSRPSPLTRAPFGVAAPVRHCARPEWHRFPSQRRGSRGYY